MKKTTIISLILVVGLLALKGINYMGWADNILGSKDKPEPQDNRSVEEMRADPNLISVYDEYGRELFITKDTWRKDVLPGTLKDNWDTPDELCNI